MGLPKAVFDDLQAQLAVNRSQVRDFRSLARKGSRQSVAKAKVHRLSVATPTWSLATLYAGYCAAHKRLTSPSKAR